MSSASRLYRTHTSQPSSRPMSMFLVLACVLLCQVVSSVRVSLDATSAWGRYTEHMRSHALHGKTVYLKNGETLYFNLCVRQDASVMISDVRYSHDGGPDLVWATIDTINIGFFWTGNHSDWGHLWNVFHSSGPVGHQYLLKNGMHTLALTAQAANGIEIDYVQLELSDQTITPEILLCKLLCSNLLPSLPRVNADVPENATIFQMSYRTTCAEEDNVKIPVFLKNILEYNITATLPKYRTYINARTPNTTNCPSLPSVYWKITHIVIPKFEGRVYFDKIRLDYVTGSNNPYTSQALEIAFNLKGRSTGYIDADIGAKATIQIKASMYKVAVRMLYKGRAGKFLPLPDQVFNPGETTKVWHIPDFSWTEYEPNVLRVLIAVYGRTALTIEYIQLERRYMRPDRVFTIFKSEAAIIEGIDVDFWWRAPETMVVHRVDNVQVFKKVDFFRISVPVPWSTGYAQTFVLYQDGNVRLLELPPPGLDWIPFGSSVIVGQTITKDFRPSAPVARMELSPLDLTMILFYKDGGKAKLSLDVRMSETVLTVSELEFAKDTALYPFATFRSMYIKDGNSDSDSVLIDGKYAHYIMRGWKSLSGKSFMLFRRCESKHLTLSPDIRLDIARTSSSPYLFWSSNAHVFW